MRARGLFNMVFLLLAGIFGAMVAIGDGPAPVSQGSDELAVLSEALEAQGIETQAPTDEGPSLSVAAQPTPILKAEPTPAVTDSSAIEAAVTGAVLETATVEPTTVALPLAEPAAQTPLVEVASEPAPEPKRMGVVTGTRVNVRSGPSTANGVIAKVVRGQEVELLGYADNGWANILVDGEIGYMSGDFIREAPQG